MVLRKISPEELQEIFRKHQLWLDGEDGGERANLVGANLVGANLESAYLDYSCLPLWCGSLMAHFDDRQLKQIAYHLVKAGLHSKNASDETKAEIAKLVDFANGFHRVKECGEIKLDT